MELQILIRKFYGLADAAHINHVNTRSYPAHVALGEFYASVIEVKDKMIEYLMGQGKLASVKASVLEIKDDVVPEADVVAKAFCEYAESLKDEAMINLAGEFQESVGKLKYLLMLK